MSFPYRARIADIVGDFARRYHWAAHSIDKTDPVALARMISFEECPAKHVVSASEVLRLLPTPRARRSPREPAAENTPTAAPHEH